MSDLFDVRVYTTIAWLSTALLAYDCLITLGEEIELVWNSRWGFPKVLFFGSRYLGVGVSLANAFASTLATDASFCNLFYNALSFLIVVTIGVADSLLLVRILALYHSNKTLQIALLIFSGVLYLMELGLQSVRLFLRAGPATSDGPDLGCYVASIAQPPRRALVVTVPILALNTLFFILTVIKLLPSWRQAPDLQTPLSTLIIRDGTMYYIIIGSVLAVSTVFPVIFAERDDLTTVGSLLLVAISPMAACRTFLNLKELGRARRREMTVETAVVDGDVSDLPTEDSDSTEMSDSSTTTRNTDQILSTCAEPSTSASC